MRISVDFDVCESNALCEALAPMHFRIDDDDYLQIIEEDVTEETREAVEEAVAACPKAAISLVD